MASCHSLKWTGCQRPRLFSIFIFIARSTKLSISFPKEIAPILQVHQNIEALFSQISSSPPHSDPPNSELVSGYLPTATRKLAENPSFPTPLLRHPYYHHISHSLGSASQLSREIVGKICRGNRLVWCLSTLLVVLSRFATIPQQALDCCFADTLYGM